MEKRGKCNYKVILLGNREYKKTLYFAFSKEGAYKRYHQLLEQSRKVAFPKKFLNSYKIKPVKYEICVVKRTEPTDTFRTIRDDLGKTFIEEPTMGWTILTSEVYYIEETFWVYSIGKKHRPKFDEIVKILSVGAFRKNVNRQVIVVHNKLVIHNEDSFDMVICKCIQDAQRLHHALYRATKKQKIKSLLFMGTATPASASQLYDIIHSYTGWSYIKMWRHTTRP